MLNEQSAGYYAHGYFMATKKTAGLIFTTGPGLTNGVSGIAACYYDIVPLVTLVGQVPTRLNISKKTRTRMVGFQEVPHLEICEPISDFTFKVDNIKSFKDNRSKILSNLNSKVQIIEVLDDVQRMKINNIKSYIYEDGEIKDVTPEIKQKEVQENKSSSLFADSDSD